MFCLWQNDKGKIGFMSNGIGIFVKNFRKTDFVLRQYTVATKVSRFVLFRFKMCFNNQP